MRNPTSGVRTEGTVDGAGAVAMSIDPQGMAHVMSVLTNLYSDAPLAVVREYATNARDAHLAAGTERPVQVMLPTELEPTLRVRDFGHGLSEEAIIGVYARYGASTKRDSDEQIGAFGLGSKSAFTLAGQFVVTSVSQGWRTVVLFGLGADGVGAVSVLQRGPAGDGESSGVEVSIPVPDVGAVRAAARRFFATWPPGSVLVDGRPPGSVRDGALLDCPAVVLAASDCPVADDGWQVVMGGVAYRLPTGLLDRAARTAERARTLTSCRALRRVYLTVPVGGVDITPSREALRDTDRTVRAVRTALAELPEQVLDVVQQAIASAPDLPGAGWAAGRYADRLDLAPLLPWDRLVHGGQPIPPTLHVPLPTFSLGPQGRRGGRPLQADTSLAVPLRHQDRVLVVTGTPKGAATHRPAHRYLLAHRETVTWLVYAAEDSGVFGAFAFGPDRPVPTIDYRELRERADRLEPADERRETTYLTMLPGQHPKPTFRGAGWLREQPQPPVVLDWASFHSRLAKRVFVGRPVVELTGTKTLSGLVRRVPGAVDGQLLLLAGARRLLAELTPAQVELIEAIDFQTRYSGTVSHLTRLLDSHTDRLSPAIRRALLDPHRHAEQLCQADPDEVGVLTDARRMTGADPDSGQHRPLLDQWVAQAPLLPLLLRVPYLDPDERAAATAYLNTHLTDPDAVPVAA